MITRTSLLFSLFFSIPFLINAKAGTDQDVVLLKDGSILIGTVLEKNSSSLEMDVVGVGVQTVPRKYIREVIKQSRFVADSNYRKAIQSGSSDSESARIKVTSQKTDNPEKSDTCSSAKTGDLGNSFRHCGSSNYSLNHFVGVSLGLSAAPPQYASFVPYGLFTGFHYEMEPNFSFSHRFLMRLTVSPQFQQFFSNEVWLSDIRIFRVNTGILAGLPYRQFGSQWAFLLSAEGGYYMSQHSVNSEVYRFRNMIVSLGARLEWIGANRFSVGIQLGSDYYLNNPVSSLKFSYFTSYRL